MRVLDVVDHPHGHDRPEDLHVDQLVRVGVDLEDGRLDVESLLVRVLAPPERP